MNQRRNFIKKNLFKAVTITALVLCALPVSSASSIGGYFIPGGMYGGESGYYYWEDYCPLCDRYGCLGVNPKGTYEGEVTCYICDADYDGCTGYDKFGAGARARLIPAVLKEPEVAAQSTEETSEQNTNNTTVTPNATAESLTPELTSKSLVPSTYHPETTITVDIGLDNVPVNNTVLQAHLKTLTAFGWF